MKNKTCKVWKWEKNNPTKGIFDNPYKRCYECQECENYSDYVAQKISGELD